MSLENLTLMKFLNLSPIGQRYNSKALELRDNIVEWLSYIPATFPHYTSHSGGHSERIISQIGKMLFHHDDPKQPIVNLSHVEAYILIASAYLHDSGMVVSNQEKEDLLKSSKWQQWVGEEPSRSLRLGEIDALRGSTTIPTLELRNFLADVQFRYLVAEYFRKNHHLRAGDVIVTHEMALGRFAFGDAILRSTIANVCVSHGLSFNELENPKKFPEERDIRDEKVNVKFLAILLRLGDLLDLRHDRACPLLLNAASPLPADSLAHWTQYGCISHENTSPQEIQVIAKCSTQDEHRVLQDWCSWIVDEVKNAAISMAHSKRHNAWKPPFAKMDGMDATISIEPAESASYVPKSWKFEFDHDLVLRRLIHDNNIEKFSFVRELVQNALDASRCKLFFDMKGDGADIPGNSNEVSVEALSRYPIHISLSKKIKSNPLSGAEETVHQMVIEDFGIGMNEYVIERYFLQIGRSFYRSDDFKSHYGFNPTGRFGVGFLSVFTGSENVVVETLSHFNKPEESIKICLKGPKSYFLVEKASFREKPGTKVIVDLSTPISEGELTKFLKHLCLRTEFPIFVNEYGQQTTILKESAKKFEVSVKNIGDPKEKFCIKAIPFETPVVRGEMYVFEVRKDGDVDWTKRRYAESYLLTYPDAKIPHLPHEVSCFHGLRVSSSTYNSSSVSFRYDVRTSSASSNLDRTKIKYESGDGIENIISEIMDKNVFEHISSKKFTNAEQAWSYKLRLCRDFDDCNFWIEMPGLVKVRSSKTKYLSISDVQLLPRIEVLYRVKTYNSFSGNDDDINKFIDASISAKGNTLVSTDNYLPERIVNEVFKGKTLVGVKCLHLAFGVFRAVWEDSSRGFVPPAKTIEIKKNYRPDVYHTRSIEGEKILGAPLHYPFKTHVVLNSTHDLAAWISDLHRALGQNPGIANEELKRAFFDAVQTTIEFGGYKSDELARHVATFNRLHKKLNILASPFVKGLMIREGWKVLYPYEFEFSKKISSVSRSKSDIRKKSSQKKSSKKKQV